MKLNLGAGNEKYHVDGYVNLDLKTGDSAYPLSYPDNSAEEIRASHLLEHFGHHEVPAVLAEWVRVLQPGGLLKIAVPNFEYIVDRYEEGAEEPILGYLMGGQQDEHDFHKTIFDKHGLTYLLEQAGLVEITEWVSEIMDCAALPVSLNLQGRKPLLVEAAAAAPAVHDRRLKGLVAAVMSLPRLTFTDNLYTAAIACLPLGISLERSTGVFWGQCLSSMFERHLEDGTKYLLTLDYDTVFTQADILALYDLMEANPTVDALTSVQMRRGFDYPLLSVRDEGKPGNGEREIARRYFTGALAKIDTAHFGLTLLRVESLKRVARPWFHAVPDEQGGWGAGRKDEDIAFWHKWAAAGNSLYLAPRVVIGHMQLMVTWPDTNLQATHQYMSAYNQGGKPPNVWR